LFDREYVITGHGFHDEDLDKDYDYDHGDCFMHHNTVVITNKAHGFGAFPCHKTHWKYPTFNPPDG
jgi:hypothetical protein